jgi:antitoxin component YwqK of YwqJK toxin-antitoxin module
MKKQGLWILIVGIALCSCQTKEEKSPIVSQKFVHKYGFPITKNDWEEKKEGQVIAELSDGSTATYTYANGVLHGTTTYTYPKNTQVQKTEYYDEGTLLKCVDHDEEGIPSKETAFAFDNRKVVTKWDKTGTPMSLEEFENEVLVKGNYFSPNNEKESLVENGKGIRIQRSREGTLLTRDTMENGQMIFRLTFHYNGIVQSESTFENWQLHGKQKIYAESGLPVMELQWDHGVLHGLKILYQNGRKTGEIPFVHGEKQGIEKQFDPITGQVTAEIPWEHDQKQGKALIYDTEGAHDQWYYQDQSVSLSKFQMMQLRDKMVADLHDEKR